MKRKILTGLVAGAICLTLASCGITEPGQLGAGGVKEVGGQQSGSSAVDEKKQTKQNGGIDERVRDAEFTDGLIQVCDMVLKPDPDAANYYDKKYIDTVEGLIGQISSHSKEKFTIVNDDESEYNAEKLIADGMTTHKLLVKTQDGKVRLQIEYANRSGKTCALKDCGANIIMSYDALSTLCEFPTYIWRGIDPNDSKWNYSTVTELFKPYEGNEEVGQRESNSYDNKKLVLTASFKAKAEDDPMGIHSGTVGYEFVFDADTADLLEVNPFYYVISKVMYFEFLD